MSNNCVDAATGAQGALDEAVARRHDASVRLAHWEDKTYPRPYYDACQMREIARKWVADMPRPHHQIAALDAACIEYGCVCAALHRWPAGDHYDTEATACRAATRFAFAVGREAGCAGPTAAQLRRGAPLPGSIVDVLRHADVLRREGQR